MNLGHNEKARHATEDTINRILLLLLVTDSFYRNQYV